MTANQIAYWNYVENSRHNLASETEAKRSNLAKERESNRSNVANEVLKGREIDVKQASNLINDAHYVRSDQETQRHNAVMENYYLTGNALRQAEVQQGYAQLANSRYIAELSNQLGYANLAEQTRYNKENAAIGNRNVSVGRINAKANTLNSLTRSREQDLKEQQWSDPYVAGTRKYSYAQSRLNTIKTQADIDYTKVSTMKLGLDAGTNVLNSIANLTNSAARLVPAVGGMLQ